jgi:hypothetical protein
MTPFWRNAALPRPPSATRRLRQTEKAFRQQVVQLARLRGFAVYWTWTSLHSPAGFPDLVLCRPPRLIFAELKTDNARPTEPQKQWLDLLARCPGCETYLWRPSLWAEVDATLE